MGFENAHLPMRASTVAYFFRHFSPSPCYNWRMDPRKIPLAAVLIILSGTVLVFLVVALTTNTAEAPIATDGQGSAHDADEPHTAEDHTEERDPASHDHSGHDHPSPFPLNTYDDGLIQFQYPAFVQENDPKGAYAWLTYPHTEVGHPPRSETFLSINRTGVSEDSFDEYVSNFRDWLENDGEAFDAVETAPEAVHEVPAMIEARFALSTTTINGLPVMFEKSNYGGASGNIYFMTVWLGDGTVLEFLSEYAERELLEIAYFSIRSSR